MRQESLELEKSKKKKSIKNKETSMRKQNGSWHHSRQDSVRFCPPRISLSHLSSLGRPASVVRGPRSSWRQPNDRLFTKHYTIY